MSHITNDVSTPNSSKGFINPCLCQALTHQTSICVYVGGRERGVKERHVCTRWCGDVHLCMCKGTRGEHSVSNSITALFLWDRSLIKPGTRTSPSDPPVSNFSLLTELRSLYSRLCGFCGFELRSLSLPSKSSHPRSHCPSLTHLLHYFA